MDLRRVGRVNGPLYFVMLGLATTMSTPAIAGDHHQTILVPVAVTTAQPVVSAAPVAAAPVLTAGSPVLVAHHKLFHPYTQYYQVPLTGSAPVSYYQTTTASAPVSYVQTTTASAPVSYVQVTANAPTTASAPVATTKPAAAPTAAAPTNSNTITYTYSFNGTSWTLTQSGNSSSIGSAPTDAGSLSAGSRASILAKLAPFVSSYTDLNLDQSVIRSSVRSKAVAFYDETSSRDSASPEGTKEIDSIVDEALGASPTTSSSSKTGSTTTNTNVTTTTTPMVPVIAPAPATQLFLQMKVKHGHLRYQ